MRRASASDAPTMSDVAALAGVSVPTVSRVVRGTVPVSEDKSERVRSAIAQLDYRPSAAARALAHGTSTIVGVLAARASGYGYAATIEGIHDECRRHGWTVAVQLLERRDGGAAGDPTELVQALDPIMTQRLVGAIVIGFDAVAFDAVPILLRQHRVVLASGSRSDAQATSQVHLDDFVGAYEATTRLLQIGHATVHHVAVPGAQRDLGRTGGWRAALRDAGARQTEPWQVSWDPSTARDVGLQIPADGSVTAVLCGNDETAMGLVRGLGERGVRVPDDVSVVGFDDNPLGRFFTPSLSTVRLDFAELGRRAASMLIDGGQSGEVVAVAPTLVLRESVRSVRTAAPRRS